MAVYSHPSSDPVKALILERQKQYRKTDSELARTIGVSPRTFSRMMSMHTDNWKLRQIRKLCWALNVTKEQFTAVISK